MIPTAAICVQWSPFAGVLCSEAVPKLGLKVAKSVEL